MQQPVVDVRKLNKNYQSGTESVAVLQDVELVLLPGQSLALMGPSGSGKSTLLNILSGLESWNSGTIKLFGSHMSQADEARWTRIRRTAIATVFQEANLMPALTLAENLRLRVSLAGGPEPDPTKWLDRLGLTGLQHRYPDQVSGGQRQRAALAMAFAMSPRLILADEPTGSLDRRTADQVAEVMFSFQHEFQCPLILATHDPTLADGCGQRLTLGQTG